jgi:hypothetical protein
MLAGQTPFTSSGLEVSGASPWMASYGPLSNGAKSAKCGALRMQNGVAPSTEIHIHGKEPDKDAFVTIATSTASGSIC